MLSQTSKSGAPSGSKRKLEFAYDHLGRRIQKRLLTWNGSSYVESYKYRFVYDGWNMLAELNSTILVRSYIWGTDLSGSLQG
ncbi:MAG: hypothetical protein SFY81_15820 [Verrucomicrobiota bacterium]|nr:hypothetical protein [Verrucomicrobiota bacterium]